VLYAIAYFTGKGANESSYFNGNKNSNWLVVAYGMIGTSLSGVTFMSVPGDVGITHFAYFQIVIGYLLGYLVVALVLMPLYYKLQLTSIYDYLLTRFGIVTYKTGASFFLLSRTLGATLRLFLVINVLQLFILDTWHIPFAVTAFAVIVLILLYTFQGGVKTIIWTDLLQTTFMLIALVVCVIFIKNSLQLNFSELFSALDIKGYTKVFETNPNSKAFFLKQIIGGAFITIAMTGMDQEMMQKNISVKNIAGAQKNMLTFSLILLLVNLLFLLLGGILFLYAESHHISQFISIDNKSVFQIWNSASQTFVNGRTDDLFPTIATQYLPPVIGVIFLIGLISALFPSADGAITALTSSFCIDILGIQRNAQLSDAGKKRTRLFVHFSVAAIFLLLVIAFKIINQQAIIKTLLLVASFTYGPLLGLFSFGILTSRNLKDKWVPAICLIAPICCYGLFQLSEQKSIYGDYQIGLELLLINGLLTFGGLWCISSKAISKA
jgi:Na+/proline symporter